MLTVLLSVYKGDEASFLNDALLSIYDNQTLKPGQIVLVKDGPLSEALDKVISQWIVRLGNKLTIVSLEKNVGLGHALNEGLAYCKYELVARMDADDIAMPHRFEKQVRFMNLNPHIAASSSQIEEWDSAFKKMLYMRNLPTEVGEVMSFAKRRSPLSHPASIFRKTIVRKVGGYPPLRKAQDYALWSLLISKGYSLGNLSDTLLKMRAGEEMLNRRGWNYFKQEYQLLKYQNQIGFLSNQEFLINSVLKGGLRLSPNFIKRLVYRFAR